MDGKQTKTVDEMLKNIEDKMKGKKDNSSFQAKYSKQTKNGKLFLRKNTGE